MKPSGLTRPLGACAGRSWIRKAAVILIPAYTLAVMYDVLESPGLLLRHALDDIRTELSGTESRVFSAAELQALSGGKRPMLRYVLYRLLCSSMFHLKLEREMKTL